LIEKIVRFGVVNTTERLFIQTASIHVHQTKPLVAFATLERLNESPQEPVDGLPQFELFLEQFEQTSHIEIVVWHVQVNVVTVSVENRQLTL
jgi:hypothetical protein